MKMNPDFLMNELPPQKYLDAIRPSILAESDRGVAIMCSALVEQALKASLCEKLSHLSEAERQDWFEGHNAPFRSFDAKIRLGRGLKIYDDGVQSQLNLVRKIRNVFAHRSLPLEFDHEGLATLRNPLLEGLGKWEQLETKELFAGFCLGVVHALGFRGVE